MSLPGMAGAIAGASGSSGPGYRYFKLNVTNTNQYPSFGVEINEWELASSTGGATLIQSKTITASSFNGGTFVATNANDGVLSNGWESTTGFPQWIKVDMGAGNGFNPAEMRLWNNGFEQPKDFELLGSNNDSTYTSIKSWTGITSWTGSPATVTLAIP